MKQVTMYKIPHTHVTTEAMTTAHYFTGVLDALLYYMYDVRSKILLDCRSAKYTINGATKHVRKKVALNKSLAVTLSL